MSYHDGDCDLQGGGRCNCSRADKKDVRIALLEDALKKIVSINVQYAKDCWGDAAKAETMACVVTARRALAQKP